MEQSQKYLAVNLMQGEGKLLKSSCSLRTTEPCRSPYGDVKQFIMQQASLGSADSI
jgi:hypothetical protein